MKALAEFVMRGRLQSLLVAMAGAGSLLLCWVSAAVIALVTLRRGAGQGAWLLLWALLPAGALMLVFGDGGPLALLVATTALALVLRATVSLPLAILASVPVAVLSGFGLLLFGQVMLEQLVGVFDQFLAGLEQQLAASNGQVVRLLRPTGVQIAGMMGTATGVLSVICLLLARWWQALLYNPGGFGAEFRALHYPPAITLAMVVPGLLLASLGMEYRTWAVMCLIPLNFAGIALVHARVAWRGQGSGRLTVFYLLWLFLDPVKLVVVAAAVADSWLRFRQRWVSK
ncbi:MAG: hypothetical protein ACK5HY_09285 [Parahaliea sp.]